MSETVLAVSADGLFCLGVGSNDPLAPAYIPGSMELLELILFRSVWVDRDAAEKDETFLQVIPYTVIRSGITVLGYSRMKQSGERRLVGKRSIGIGGHINPVLGEHGIFYTFWMEVERELNEELTLGQYITPPQFHGFIVDRSTEVGRVHVGCVLSTRIESPHKAHSNCPSVGNLTWEPVLRHKEDIEQFEPWSQILLNDFPWSI